ncbi:MAG: 50S ribosomal protein L20 [Patescibacteria group bacterium]
MPRVKRGTIGNKRRRNVLKQTKGFRFGRSNKERAAREALLHAGKYALADRRDKKNNFRQLWQIKIGASTSAMGLSYSRFIDGLKKRQVALDRKVLAELAEHEPKTFAKIVEFVKA